MVIAVIYVAILLRAAVAQVGPNCSSKNDLPYLIERVAGYNMSSSENAISDFYLPEGWYSIPGFILSSDPLKKCGSHNFWYMNGSTLPDTNAILTKTICFADGSVCGFPKQIRVAKCSENDYRFYLPPTDATDEAYCTSPLNSAGAVDPAPNVTYISPKIEVRIATPNSGEFVLEIVCNFIVKPEDRKLLYTVEWSITDTSGKIKHLQTTTSDKSDETKFTDETKLTQKTLMSNGINKLGFRAMCSVRAKSSSAGNYTSAMNSDSKFFGIEVLSKPEIRVVGNEKVTLSVRLTVPFRCKTASSMCTYDLLLIVPKNDSCQTQSIRATYTDNQKICGARFATTDVDKIKNITITNLHGQSSNYIIGTVYNLIFRTQSLFGHDFFSDYIPDPIRINSVVDYKMVANALCYSHGDPYVKSFDARLSATQYPGTFMLYRNREYNIEVHTRHTPCTTWSTAYCNSAVAIRAGRDVYVFDLEKDQTAFTSCDDGVLAGKIRRDGQYLYKVFLPTGAEMTIAANGLYLLDIDIIPGVRDFDKTDGLCGKFDNNATNDQDKPSGCTQERNLCWRIEDNYSLFNKSYVQSLQGWSEKLNLCTCNCSYPTCIFNDTVNCGPDSREWCSIDLFKTVNHGICYAKRKKRSADIHRRHEFQIDVSQSKKIVQRTRREVTPGPMDLDTAKIICMREMNTTSVQICSGLPGLDVESYYEDCARDLMITNSYEWIQQHTEGLKRKCLYFVKVRQPLPQHVLEHVNLVQYDDENDTIDDSIFDSDLLRHIYDVSCPNDCSKSGQCVHGKCKCNSGYINEDCSILYSEPPEMIGIPDNGLCDLAERPCEQTMVIGRHFVESDNLSCKLVPLKVDRVNQVQRGNPYIHRAEMDTFVQVMCPLTQNPARKRRLDQFDIKTLTVGYFISVSNNREVFSQEDSILFFNSVCMSCTKQEGLIQCSQKSGYCAHEGRCFNEGDVLDCYTCQGNPLAWTPGKDCDTNSSASDKRYWIIGAVLGSVIAIAVAVAVAYKLCSSNASVIKPNSSLSNDKIDNEEPCVYTNDQRRCDNDYAVLCNDAVDQRPASAISRERTLGTIELFEANTERN